MGKLISLLFFTGILFYSTASSGNEPLPVVAVFGIQDVDAGLEQDSLDKFNELMGAAISAGGVYRVVPPSEILRILLKKKDTHAECFDKECQFEIGRDLGADKSMSTIIRRTSEACVVVSSLYNLDTQSVDYSAKEQGSCDETGLDESIKKVATKILLWAGMGKIDKEVEVSPAEEQEDGGPPKIVASTEASESMSAADEQETEVSSPVDEKSTLAVSERRRKSAQPVSDLLLTVGMSTNYREGLIPKHKSDTEFGLRVDGRFFLGSLTDKPILRDIGLGGYFNKVFDLKYGVTGNDDWDASQHQWQFGIIYRLAILNNIVLQPTFLIRIGYGETSCTIDVDEGLAKSASYSYPYAALDVYLMLFKPYLRLHLSGEYMFAVSPGEDLDGDLGSGYSIRIGLDVVVLRYLNIGVGYDFTEFFAMIQETDITDSYEGFLFSAGFNFK